MGVKGIILMHFDTCKSARGGSTSGTPLPSCRSTVPSSATTSSTATSMPACPSVTRLRARPGTPSPPGTYRLSTTTY